MTATTREHTLRAIRQALVERPPTQLPEPLPARPALSPGELVAQFIREAEAAGATVAAAENASAAREQISRWLQAAGARRVVCAPTPLASGLALAELSSPDCWLELLDAAGEAEKKRATCLAADAGISDADYGLADTGTLVLRGTPAQGRLVSLLPPVHIAVLSRARILPDLAACFRALDPALRDAEAQRTSLLTLITGPSRTADIEQTLTVGVHGPAALCILLVD